MWIKVKMRKVNEKLNILYTQFALNYYLKSYWFRK